MQLKDFENVLMENVQKACFNCVIKENDMNVSCIKLTFYVFVCVCVNFIYVIFLKGIEKNVSTQYLQLDPFYVQIIFQQLLSEDY